MLAEGEGEPPGGRGIICRGGTAEITNKILKISN